MIRQIIKENPSFIEKFKLKKEVAKRDYKAEYKKFQSSDKAKKYRAELNQYNRKKGTYGNGDGKDASHKGGKIVGFESQSKNRGRAEKSRLKKEVLGKRCTVKEISKWLKTLEEFRYRKVRGVDARRVASFVNSGMNEEELPISLQKKWEHKQYGREKHLANKYVETVLNVTLKEFVNEDWWSDMDAASQSQYIKDHPNSAKAKSGGKEEKPKSKKEPSHAEIIDYIEDEGWGGDAIGSDGNPTPEAYQDAKDELMAQKKESVNEGTKAFLAYREMKEALNVAIYGIKKMRKFIDDAPYNPKFNMITKELYKWEIDLEKKWRRVVPQISKISKDKMLESVNEAKTFTDKDWRIAHGIFIKNKFFPTMQRNFEKAIKDKDIHNLKYAIEGVIRYMRSAPKKQLKMKIKEGLHPYKDFDQQDDKKQYDLNLGSFIDKYQKMMKFMKKYKEVPDKNKRAWATAVRKKVGQSKFNGLIDDWGQIVGYLKSFDSFRSKKDPHAWDIKGESVNESVEPRGNIKKVLDVAKNKQARKIGGTLVDGTTANMMTQVWDKVNDKSKEKMNKMNTKQLIRLILKLWDRLGTPRV